MSFLQAKFYDFGSHDYVCRLCISPDQNLPKVVACVVKNDILLLCICDYMDDKDCSEINIGECS